MSLNKLRIVMRVLLGVTLGIVVLYALADYSLNRSLNNALGPEFQKDAQDLGTALKGIAGESLFEHGALVPSEQQMPAGSNGIEKGKTLLAAYRRDPAKFKKYGDLLQTALNASAVADALLQMPSSAKLPPDSLGITSVRTEQKTDAWGHPFCLLAERGRVAVISAGPDPKSPFVCENLGVSSKEILSAGRKLYERPSGEVVMIVDRSLRKSAFEQTTQKP